MNNKNSYDKRRSNIPNGGRNSKNQNKVNNGVFVYNRAMSVSELAKQLNITPSDIIKFLCLQKKMVTINQTLDDESIGMVCLNFG